MHRIKSWWEGRGDRTAHPRGTPSRIESKEEGRKSPPKNQLSKIYSFLFVREGVFGLEELTCLRRGRRMSNGELILGTQQLRKMPSAS